MARHDNTVSIEVAYALPAQQEIRALAVQTGTTMLEAIEQSGMLSAFPDIDKDKLAIGVFGKRRELTDIVQEGDRIEIYRPLLIQPKEARRAKAKAAKKR